MAERIDRERSTSKRKRKQRVLVPSIYESVSEHLIAMANAFDSNCQVFVLGVIPVETDLSLSKATHQARELRTFLRKKIAPLQVRIWPKILVSHAPDYEIASFVASQKVDLLLMPWAQDNPGQNLIAKGLFTHCPCDVILIKGVPPIQGGNILLVLRPGPHSELALQLALGLARSRNYTISSLRPAATSDSPEDVTAGIGLDQVMAYLPQVERAVVADSILISDNPEETILEESNEYDLVILGAAAHDAENADTLDALAETFLKHASCPLIIARSHDFPIPFPSKSDMGLGAISILVDKWFAENTFHANEFEDLKRLIAIKQDQGITISLALPALNEEAMVGNVIKTIKQALVDQFPLLDEMVLIDSNSTDHTREIATGLGIPVYIHQHLLPQYDVRHGKGEALWKSLYVTKGDIVLWIDTDIVNIHPRFIYGLIGPLLLRPDLMFIKGFYLRPIKVGDKLQAAGGGRVTELTARPLLNLFYPALSGIIQPLSGEYGGRREALERLPFSSGYGVEIGLMIDILERFGLGAIGQVDLIQRLHHNQPLAALSKMSFAIIQTVIRKIDRRYDLQLLQDVNRSMKLIRREGKRFALEVEEIAERERPPMISLPEYQKRFHKR
jgi:glycosyltransferase involved in cell wall biosynthesis/nucleotide-binding universal stress UspA family protein